LPGSKVSGKPDASSILVAFMPDDPVQPRLGKHGGPRIKGQRTAEVMPSGSRRDYILARLERDGRHDLAAAIREDRVSAYSIAVELGWTKRAEPAGISSSGVNAAKRRQHQLWAVTGEGLSSGQMMELWLGTNPSAGSLFNSREELEQAWTEHRDELMARWGSHGRRPMIWWELAAGDLKYPGYAHERSFLWRAGVLTADERAELEAEWKTAFAEAVAPEFTLNDGNGILVGDCARAAHYAHHDIPDKLVKRWSAAARRRRARQPVISSAPTEEVVAVK
jgi:hypothetical protein